MNKRDNTLVWVIVSLLICIGIQLIGTMGLKNQIKDLESKIVKLKKQNEVHK
jgi:cell division protein FtsB